MCVFFKVHFLVVQVGDSRDYIPVFLLIISYIKYIAFSRSR